MKAESLNDSSAAKHGGDVAAAVASAAAGAGIGVTGAQGGCSDIPCASLRAPERCAARARRTRRLQHGAPCEVGAQSEPGGW